MVSFPNGPTETIINDLETDVEMFEQVQMRALGQERPFCM